MSVNQNFSIGFFIYHTSVLSYAHCTALTTTFMLAYIFSWPEIVCFCGLTAPSKDQSLLSQTSWEKTSLTYTYHSAVAGI